MKRCTLFILCGMVGWFLSFKSAHAQGTLFTYQGILTVSNGVAATGVYDMQFKLHPAATGTNQVGTTLTNATVGVTDGLFTVPLDFGATVFNGSALWLEIGVRTNGSVAPYTILAPTQELTPAPYAVYAGQAVTTGVFTGTIADSQLSTNIPQFDVGGTFGSSITLSNGHGNFNGTLSGTFNGAATGTFIGTSTGTNMGTFIGNGAGVTNLNVTNLTGVVQSNLNWQLVQSTSQQAQVANDYLTTNAAQTTLTLPTSPSVGNSLRISGSGAGGWVIAQSGSQSILTGRLGLPAGKVWTPSTSASPAWRAIASSTNGLKMVAVVNNGLLYTSVDGGQTWTSRTTTSQAWISVASSADGTHLAAAVNVGNIYVSTNSGANWFTPNTTLGNLAWYSIAASADGTKLVAVVNNGPIYTSVNSGTNWTIHSISKPWTSVASSADGTKLAAVANGDFTYSSANSGTTWTTNTSLGALPWQTISSSADGVQLVAAVNNGFIYTSGDSGANWTQRTTTSQAWYSVSSSANGANLLAAVDVGLVYSSFDGGQTWTARTSGNQAWNAVTVSGDGTRAAAAINGGLIYCSLSATTVGTGGSLVGAQYSVIELQYVGSGLWIPLSFTGLFSAF